MSPQFGSGYRGALGASLLCALSSACQGSDAAPDEQPPDEQTSEASPVGGSSGAAGAPGGEPEDSPNVDRFGPDAIVVTDDSHLDVLSISYDGAALQLNIDHADHPDLLSPASAFVELGAAHRTLLPETPELLFLGEPGESVWHLDGGWSVRDVEEGTFVDNEIEVHLEDVEGPGAFAAWRFGAIEPEVYFASVEPLPQAFVIEHDAHAHRNWSFSEPGDYLISISVSALRASDNAPLRSQLQVYAFRVLE